MCFFCHLRLALEMLCSLTHGTVKSEKACLHIGVCSTGKSLLALKSLVHDNDANPVK